jgi:uncharacterized protein (DUF305 family)
MREKSMTSKSLVGAALTVLTAGVVLAGCSGNSGGHDMNTMNNPPTAAPNSGQAGHNQADVAFAQQMIPHHQGAIEMAKLADGRTTNPQVLDLAGRIQKAQDPEIRQMTGWLTAWGAAPAPTGMGGMPPMSGHSMPGMDHNSMPMPSGAPIPGMMNPGDMAKLQQVKGAEFDHMWLQGMILHHQGAIDMARTEFVQGSNAEAKALAQRIIDAQQAEITEMKGLLGQH